MFTYGRCQVSHRNINARRLGRGNAIAWANIRVAEDAPGNIAQKRPLTRLAPAGKSARREPPSPLGEGNGSSGAPAPRQSFLPPPRGEGGPRPAFSPAVAGRMRGHFPAVDDHLHGKHDHGLTVIRDHLDGFTLSETGRCQAHVQNPFFLVALLMNPWLAPQSRVTQFPDVCNVCNRVSTASPALRAPRPGSPETDDYGPLLSRC